MTLSTNHGIELFKGHMSGTDIKDIREATNKVWVLGNDWFIEKIEKLLAQQVKSKSRGEDRRPKEFQTKANDRVWSHECVDASMDVKQIDY